MKSFQKEQNSTNLLLYDPQSAGINMQSPLSDLTPWTLTLPGALSQHWGQNICTLSQNYEALLIQLLIMLISRNHMYTQKSIHFLAWTRGTRSKCKYLAGSLFLYIFLPSSSLKIFFYLCISCFLNVFTLLKVSYFQNFFFLSSIGPKYQQKIFQDFCPSL